MWPACVQSSAGFVARPPRPRPGAQTHLKEAVTGPCVAYLPDLLLLEKNRCLFTPVQGFSVKDKSIPSDILSKGVGESRGD